MSSIPGYTLEDFVLWNHDLVVDDHKETNLSVQIAEVVGTVEPRLRLLPHEFKVLMGLFEQYREPVEYYLDRYDEEENGSWRDYSSIVFDCIPEAVYSNAWVYLDGIKEGRMRQGLLLKELRQMVKYARWQIEEGAGYHPTLPSAVGSAQTVITAVVGDAEKIGSLSKRVDALVKAKQVAIIDKAAQIVLDNGTSNTGVIHPSSRHDADKILELKKTI